MAPPPQRPLKSLNKGPRAKRFVFKNFAQRVEEVDVDVFRSLQPVKFQPTAGSSFFHENLVQWRELNSAADFNDVYQELLPLVQTLPQLIFHKDTVLKCLLSRVHMSAALSLEPILSLIALLSRDLQEEFMPYIPPFLDACGHLLEEGAYQDPDLIEQVFISISYVFKYLNKLLSKDIPLALRVTKRLRYYPKSYVQEFAAEAISYLLRCSSIKQLIRGVRRILAEAEVDASDEKVSGCAALFFYTLKGPVSGLHSRAEPLLRLLVDRSVLSGVTQKGPEGREVALKVVAETLGRLCEVVQREKLELLWACLLEEITRELDSNKHSPLNWSNGDSEHKCMRTLEVDVSSQGGVKEAAIEEQDDSKGSDKDWRLHLTGCLSLLNGILEYRKGTRVNDYEPLFSLATRLLQPHILLVESAQVAPRNSLNDSSSELCSEVLQFLMALIKSHGRQAGASFGPATIAKTAPTWALAFTCQRATCLVPFLKGVIDQDVDLVRPFVPYVLRAACRLISVNTAEVLLLLLDLCMKMDPEAKQPFLLKNSPDSEGLITFIIQLIDCSRARLGIRHVEGKVDKVIEDEVLKMELAMFWVAVQCFPYVVISEGDSLDRCWETALAIEKHLTLLQEVRPVKFPSSVQALEALLSEEIYLKRPELLGLLGDVQNVEQNGEDTKKVWEALLGAALSAHTKVLQRTASLETLMECAGTYVGFATRHTKSAPVLRAVAEYLDTSFGHLNTGDKPRTYPVELDAIAALKFLEAVGTNLGCSDETLRVATLRVLIHFKPLCLMNQESAQSQGKRQKGNDGRPMDKGIAHCSQLMQQLLALETAPLCLENCRHSNMITARIKADVCAGHIPVAYVVPLVHGLIGVLRNPFSVLWEPAMECLAATVHSQGPVVWEVLMVHLQKIQNLFLSQSITPYLHRENAMKEDSTVSQDAQGRLKSYLLEKSESTHCATLLSLLLQTVQKLPKFAEAKSRQLLPLFLAFVGQTEGAEVSAKLEAYGGAHWKDWKTALKDWLTLLKEMKNPCSLFKGPIVKGILLHRFLMDTDPAIQKLTLDCLLNWKDGYLLSYVEHLENLVSYATLREEIVTWSIGRESHQVQDEHREGLIAVVLRILYPKILKRSGKFAGKAGAGVQRNSVLSFLAQLEMRELGPLFCLLLKPLQMAFAGTENSLSSISKPAWEGAIMEAKVTPDFIEWVDCKAVAALPYKRKMGFLHMVKDALDIFDRARLGPYLHALLAVVFKCLEGACESRYELREGQGKAELVDKTSKADGHSSAVVGDYLHSGIANADASGAAFLAEDISGKEAGEMRVSSANGRSMDVDVCKEAASVRLFSTASQVTEILEVDPGGEDDNMMTQGPENLVDGDDNERPSKTTSGTNHDSRTLCLKIISTVLTKFEDLDFHPIYWDILFQAISPSFQRFAAENHANSTPGALFSCLLAMSRSVELAPLLARDPALVPNVLSVLSVKAASPAVIAAVTSFVEGLLNLEKEGDEAEGKEVLKTVLLPHLYTLLTRVHDLLVIRREKTTGSALSVRRELKILTRLSQYVKDREEAAKLVDVLLPFLKGKKRMDQEACLEILHIIRGLVQALDVKSVKKCLAVLASLLATVATHGVRLAVCETLQVLAHVDASLLTVANLLTDLNAMSKTTLQEFDYECRLQAYEQMNTSFFGPLTRPLALLVLSHAVYDMGSVDMSLRHSSSSCLQLFVRFASSVPTEKEGIIDVGDIKPDDLEKSAVVVNDVLDADMLDDTLEEDNMVKELDSKLEAESVKSLVKTFLLPHVRNAMGSELLVVRREWVALLREMALSFPTIPALNEYQALVNTDPEVDFFNNVVHLQVHRRIKAMARFRALCLVGEFSQGALLRIFVPLFMNFIFEAKGDKEGNLVSAAVETIGCISRQLQWDPYFGLLMRLFRLLSSKPDHQKVLVRLVCATLDSFHFFETNAKPTIMEDTKEIEEGDSGLTEDKDFCQTLPAGIQELLRKRVLPEFTKLIISKMDIVNASVAIALVKILKLMPEEVIEIELPRVVQSITNLLKNRNSQAVRDEARAALVSVAAILGPRFLHFIAGVLKASLTKGFELHVLGYTLNSILVKLVPLVTVGEMDYCLEQLLEVLENDIMGEVAEEKNVEAIAGKMKETKHVRSFESMRLIAQVITVPSQVPVMLSPIRWNLQKSLAPKIRLKVEMMLKHIATGLQSNPSLIQEHLFLLVHGLIEDGVKEEKLVALTLAAKKQAKIDGSANARLLVTVTGKAPELDSRKGTNVSQNILEAPISNAHLITEFALQLFHTHLKKVKVSHQDRQALSMLDPLVGLLLECLKSKYDGILSGAMKCLCFLVRLPLPALDMHGGKISTLVFSMSQQFGQTESPLLQACFQLFIILIQHCKTAKITQEQLRLLLQSPVFADLESNTGNTAIALLKAVVGRKLLVPELYDMMVRVSELMVRSQMQPVRQVCSQVFLQFLLDYPLGTQRVQQHLDFLIANLGYEHESGREAALEMLHTVIMKFPETVVEEQSESLFLPLVTRLVNDSASHVRAMVATVLKVLMSRLGSRSLQRMLDFSLTWYKGDNRRLWRPAAQVLGLLIEVMKGKFQRHFQEVLAATVKILKQSKQLHTEEDNEESIRHWQEAYFSLTMTEKLLQQFPQYCLQTDLLELWELVCEFLLHQHSWVRKACSRLLSMYLEACGQLNEEGRSGQMLLQPSWLLLITASLCEQLDTENLDTALGDQAVRNLLYVATALPSLPDRVSVTSELVCCKDPHSQQRVDEALEMLGAKNKTSRRGEKNFSNGGLNLADESKANVLLTNEHEEDNGSASSWALLLVFKRLERIALRVQPAQTRAVLQWFAAMASRLGTQGTEPFLQCMLTPLLKITEGSAAKLVSEDLKALGAEVQGHLKEIVGVMKFLQVYNTVRQRVKDLQEKRKSAQKVSVLVDPERNAKRKIRLNAKRQKQKKRKLIESRMQQGL